MRVLLIDDDAGSMKEISELLSKKRIKAVVPLRQLQDGIETIEKQAETVSFVICNYHGDSPALMKLLLQLTAQIPTLMFIDKSTTFDHLALIPREARLDFLDRGDYPGFLQVLDRLTEDGVLETRLAPDSEFIRIHISGMNWDRPPVIDFYLRLAPNRYCLRFKKENGAEPTVIEQYGKKSGVEFLYVRKEALDAWINSQSQELDTLLESPANDVEANRKAAEENLEIVHNVVSQLGFNSKMEELVKKTVALTLKALGNNPKLSDILRKMQLQEGRYIASHSLMLAEMSCALAHRLTWSSAPTFLKLTVAAFLHDLHIPSNRLARMKTFDQITEENGFTANDLHIFKTHPIQSAEYSRNLRQLPADVDTIVLQHHEQPDGSGFPRGLYHQQISPLSCVFIVAQDLLDFFLENQATSQPKTDLFQAFVAEREQKYGSGTFKKIFESLKSGDPAAKS